MSPSTTMKETTRTVAAAHDSQRERAMADVSWERRGLLGRLVATPVAAAEPERLRVEPERRAPPESTRSADRPRPPRGRAQRPLGVMVERCRIHRASRSSSAPRSRSSSCRGRPWSTSSRRASTRAAAPASRRPAGSSAGRSCTSRWRRSGCRRCSRRRSSPSTSSSTRAPPTSIVVGLRRLAGRERAGRLGRSRAAAGSASSTGRGSWSTSSTRRRRSSSSRSCPSSSTPRAARRGGRSCVLGLLFAVPRLPHRRDVGARRGHARRLAAREHALPRHPADRVRLGVRGARGGRGALRARQDPVAARRRRRRSTAAQARATARTTAPMIARSRFEWSSFAGAGRSERQRDRVPVRGGEGAHRRRRALREARPAGPDRDLVERPRLLRHRPAVLAEPEAVRHHDEQPALVEEDELAAEEARVLASASSTTS